MPNPWILYFEICQIGNLISILDFGTVPHSLRNLGSTQFVLSFADFIV